MALKKQYSKQSLVQIGDGDLFDELLKRKSDIDDLLERRFDTYEDICWEKVEVEVESDI